MTSGYLSLEHIEKALEALRANGKPVVGISLTLLESRGLVGPGPSSPTRSSSALDRPPEAK